MGLPATLTFAALAGGAVPLSPRDHDVVGPRPIFELRCGEKHPCDPANPGVRLRLQAEPPAGGRITLQDRDVAWLAGEVGILLVRPRAPLADGQYRWSLEHWNGIEWVPSGTGATFRVDSVPPSAVRGLRVRLDPGGATLLLQWEPVTLDRDGGPEYVARYRVYRYPDPRRMPSAKPYEVASVETPMIRLPLVPGDEQLSWYYRVTAEDFAGNETGAPPDLKPMGLLFE